jgi:SAM-dependent methyltransferase
LKPRVKTYRTNGESALPFIADGSLDAALLFDVLQHVPDWDVLFSELARCLRPGGLLCVNPSELSHPGKVDLERMESMLGGAGFTPRDTVDARVAHFRHMADERIRTYAAGE